MNRRTLLGSLALALLVTACMLPTIDFPERNEWWASQGPVISHARSADSSDAVFPQRGNGILPRRSRSPPEGGGGSQ